MVGGFLTIQTAHEPQSHGLVSMVNAMIVMAKVTNIMMMKSIRELMTLTP